MFKYFCVWGNFVVILEEWNKEKKDCFYTFFFIMCILVGKGKDN